MTDNKLVVEWADNDGNQIETYAESLPDLQSELADEGYEGPRLRAVRVADDHSFTVGWVSATGWSYN